MLDLLCRREIPPAERQIGNARHVRERDEAAVFSPDAELALSLERRACHRLGYVAVIRVRASTPSRARVRGREAQDRCGRRVCPLPTEEFGYPAEGGAEFVPGAATVTRSLMREAQLWL